MAIPVITTPSLFYDCPTRCGNLVDDPRWPCGRCEKELAGYIRPSGTERTAGEVAAELAERDRHVAAIYAERRQMVPLPAGPPDKLMTSIQRAARQDLGEEYKPGQVCWVCEERRLCRKDPEFLGTRDERWICKECEAIPA